MVNPALCWESRNFPTAADFHPIFQRFTRVPVTNLKIDLTLSSLSQKPPFTLHMASRRRGRTGGSAEIILQSGIKVDALNASAV